MNIQNTSFLAVVGLLFLTAMSGCIGDGSEVSPEPETGPATSPDAAPHRESSEPASEPKPTAEFGTIKGQVVDDGFDYVVGALVTVTNDTGLIAEAFTAKDGKYTVNDLVPGLYGIRFEAECCEPFTDRVRVVAGDVRSVSPVLEVWSDMRESYISQIYEYNGFISCDAGGRSTIFFGFGYCEEDLNHDWAHGIEVQRGIKTLVVALDWDSGINFGDCLHLLVTVPNWATPQDHQFYWGENLIESEFCQKRPIELRLDAGAMWESNASNYDFANITDWMPIQFEIYANGELTMDDVGSINVIAQHPFTLYWREFHWEHAPEGATALPEK